MVVKVETLSGFEKVAVKEKQELLHYRNVGFSLGVIRVDRIRNENVKSAG